MADLDVSDLLTDPDFVQTVSLVRERQRVTDRGLTETDPWPATITAAVVPAGSLELHRGEDAETLSGKIHIYTQFPLTSGEQQENGDTVAADQVIWRNRRYVITQVDDYTNYGIGFVDATAQLQNTRNQPY